MKLSNALIGMHQGVKEGIGTMSDVMQLQGMQQQQEQQQNLYNLKMKELEDLAKPVSVATLIARVEDPEIAKIMYGAVKSTGLIYDADQPDAYIKKGDMPKIAEALKGVAPQIANIKYTKSIASLSDIATEIADLQKKPMDESSQKKLEGLTQLYEQTAEESNNLLAGLIGHKKYTEMKLKGEIELQDLVAKGGMKAPKAPKTRTITEGDEEVDQEWTGSKWKEVGRGPRTTGKGETLSEEKYRLEGAMDDLYNALYEDGLVGMDDGEYALKETYTPEEYETLKARAAEMGFEPVSREGRDPNLFLPESMEGRQYKVATFKKIEGEEAKDYGESKHPEGTTATNAKGIKIITRNGRWVEE